MKKNDRMSALIQRFSQSAVRVRRICNHLRQGLALLIGKLKKKMFAVFKKQLAACSDAMRRNREAVHYYGALALILALLATVSYMYRNGSGSSGPNADPAPAPDSMVAARANPEPTTEPSVEPPFCRPVEGEVIGSFCADSLEWNEELGQWQTHPAVDFTASAGEAVLAIADGTVLDAYCDPLYGNTIVIDHGEGRTVRYGSLNTLQLVTIGQGIIAGEIISSAGVCPAEESLGTHLHVEYYHDGTADDVTLLLSE